MSSRRNEILKELGLWPMWRLRSSAGDSPAEVLVPGSAGNSPAIVARSRSAGARPALRDRAGAVTAESPVLQKLEADASSAPALRPGGSPFGGQKRTQVVAGGEAALPLDARVEEILRMDWLQLKAGVAGCTVCPLHIGRNKTVFGVGDEHAEWLFIGEGPGADEDAKGEPFVGQAGKLLDNMLAAIGLKRGENVYIGNMVKCRPPGNRNPEPLEISQCEPYLHRQIALIKPRLIVALGKVAAVNLLRREATIASLRGKVLEYQGTPLIITYHPAYLLRSLPDKAKAWADLCFAVETMRTLQSAKPIPI